MKPEAAGELLSCRLTAPAWQHGSWTSALNEVQVACSLDAAFGRLQFSIQQRAYILRRDLQARVRLWLAKMALPTRNLTFKQMRNDHASVLLAQLSQGQLLQPFDRSPPPGPLQQLPRSMLPRSRSPGRKTPRKREGDGRQLLQYLGRRPTAGVDAETAAVGQQQQTDTTEAPKQAQQASAAGHLAGTDIAIAQLHVGRDSVELADASWQRSTLELCAQLGACRERKLELEWQLKVAKEAASQVRLRGSRSLKHEMSRLLHKYEREGSADRDSMAPLSSRPSLATDHAAPAGTARFSASEGSVRRLDSGLGSSRSPSDSQQFRSRLSAFQRGTDSLKQELSFKHVPESFGFAVE